MPEEKIQNRQSLEAERTSAEKKHIMEARNIALASSVLPDCRRLGPRVRGLALDTKSCRAHVEGDIASRPPPPLLALCCQERTTVKSGLRAAGATIAACPAAGNQESETGQEQVLEGQLEGSLGKPALGEAPWRAHY